MASSTEPEPKAGYPRVVKLEDIAVARADGTSASLAEACGPPVKDGTPVTFDPDVPRAVRLAHQIRSAMPAGSAADILFIRAGHMQLHLRCLKKTGKRHAQRYQRFIDLEEAEIPALESVLGEVRKHSAAAAQIYTQLKRSSYRAVFDELYRLAHWDPLADGPKKASLFKRLCNYKAPSAVAFAVSIGVGVLLACV